MRIAMCNALVLMRWHDFRFFRDSAAMTLLVADRVLLAAITIWALSRQRRRWF